MSFSPEPLTPHQRAIAGWTAVAVALTRFLSLARSPWDWDEALFILGMRDYDVTLHHPHPPGFPVFIAFARMVRLIVADDFRALQSVTVTASLLLFPAMLLFAREIGLRFETSLAAAVLFAAFPNVWFFGGTAFSDVPSIVLVLFATTLLLRGMGDRRAYWGGTLLLALAIGIRPQNLLVGLVPGILATLRRRPWEVLMALAIGVTVCAAAFGGAIAATGSLEEYVRVVREHADYISRVDSWKSEARPALWRMAHLFFAKQYQSPVFGFIATLFVLGALAGGLKQKSRPVLLALAAFGPFAVFAWLMLDRFSVSRFSIGYQPLFAVLAADGIRRLSLRLGRGRWDAQRVQLVIVAVIVGGFAAYAVPSFSVVRNEIAPSVAAADAVRERIDPARERLYVGHTMSKFLDLRAPGTPYTRVIDDRALPLSDVGRAWLLAEVTATSPQGLLFRREKSTLWNIARRHYFHVGLAPLTRRATFGRGWYLPELDDIHEWRWMARRSELLLPSASGVTKLRMHLALPPEVAGAPPEVKLFLNGRLVDSFRPAESYFERNYDVAPLAGGAANRLEIEVERAVQGRGPEGSAEEHALRLRYLAWGPS